jgi:hypothetical protein
MHTKGSWAISGVIEGRGDISIAADRIVVATAHNGVSFFDVIGGNHPEQQWANARLIAAAPDLLEALIAAQSLLRKCHEAVRMSLNDDIERAAATDAMASIRAAIAKATGEQ